MWNAAQWDSAANRDEHGSMMWMDPLHVEHIYRHIMRNDYRSIIEIGCWHGYSTSALVQALRDGHKATMTACDIQIAPQLRQVVGKAKVHIFHGRSTDLLQVARTCDLVILDGDHHLEAVQEEWELIREHGIGSVIAHDCGPSGDKGPQWLLEELRRLGQWRVWADMEHREGMATERGLLIATRDPKVILPDQVQAVACAT